ncbi:MAG: sn-glycerol-3-phosphate ABC transporter ATP-binding protein UgpC [Candidatus Binatia bacterium]
MLRATELEEDIASLTVNKLSKTFGASRILEEISFTVADGEFCVLLGPSGCGKTTLLRIVAGLESASGGTVDIDTTRVDLLPPQDRDVAFVFQNYALYPHMTVFENLGFSLRLHGVAKDEIQTRVSEVARLLEIDNQLNHKPQQLSGGQRQRVALGRAIVRRPKLFLFDEPLSNLDATLRANMRVELGRLHTRLGSTMLYVTHDQAEAMTLGEKIIVLDKGRIQQIGTASEIYHQPSNLFVASFVGQPQMNFIEGRLDGHGKLHSKAGVEFDLSGITGGRVAPDAQLTVGIRPEDLRRCAAADAWFAGTAEFVEDLGSDCFVHLACGGLNLVARLPAQDPIKLGQRLDLNVDPERVHLFHQERRID